MLKKYYTEGRQELTPIDARHLLDASIGNRKLNEKVVAILVEIIKSGKWQFNGASIVIDSTGKLLDGHHRLTACVRAGLPIDTMVAIVDDSTCFTTIDSGKSRSAADSLSILGYKCTHKLVSLANLLTSYYVDKSGKFLGQMNNTKTVSTGRYNPIESVTSHVLKYKLDEYILGVADKRQVNGTGLIYPSTIFAIYFIFKQISVDTAEEFIYLYRTRDGLSKNHPIAQTRAKIDSLFLNKRRQVTQKELFFYLFKAWNNWHYEKTISSVRTMQDDDILPRLVGDDNEFQWK